MPAHLTLVTRAFCPLCDDMHAALVRTRERQPFVLTIRDVDADEDLLARYNWRVPVLLAPDNCVICEGHFDAAAVSAFLG